MASFCRSAIMAGSRSLASRSKTLTSKSLPGKPMSFPFSSPSTRALPCASRFVSVLGGVESMMPLHSAIASARLIKHCRRFLPLELALSRTCKTIVTRLDPFIPLWTIKA